MFTDAYTDQANRFAAATRRLMAGPSYDPAADQTRFGGGKPLSDNRRFFVKTEARSRQVDAVYLEFRSDVEKGSSRVFISAHRDDIAFASECDLWLSTDDVLLLVSRRDIRLRFAHNGKRLVIGPEVPADDLRAGIKRARAKLRTLNFDQPAALIDQHFFEDCSLLRPFRSIGEAA